MPHLTGHDIRAEIENLAQSLAEYGHWPEGAKSDRPLLRDLSRRLQQKGVGEVDPCGLDRARRDIDTWRDLYYSVEAKLKQANFTLERVLSFHRCGTSSNRSPRASPSRGDTIMSPIPPPMRAN